MVVLAVLAALLAVGVVVLLVALRREVPVARSVPALRRALEEGELAAADAAGAADRLRQALDALPQGVVVADRDGVIVERNRTATDADDARHGEVLVWEAVDGVLAAALAGRSEERALDLFGPPSRVVTVRGTPLPAGALVVIDDVSEARRVDAVRRDFVANLSHELKTPIGAIGVLAETLLDEPDPEVARRLCERIVAESFRVSRTVDDLLELSRIEATGTAVREPVPVHLVLAEAADRLRPAAELRDIALQITEPSSRILAVGDRRQLVSAVANLLDNAVKYSAPGSVVEARAGSDGSRVRIDVVDHGLGIPARDLERIFERFYRVDRARSRDTGGTGLGLAIVRHVVANHGGEVEVDSVEGHGSTFTLHLPAAPGPVPVTDDAAPPAPRRSA